MWNALFTVLVFIDTKHKNTDVTKVSKLQVMLLAIKNIIKNNGNAAKLRYPEKRSHILHHFHHAHNTPCFGTDPWKCHGGGGGGVSPIYS